MILIPLDYLVVDSLATVSLVKLQTLILSVEQQEMTSACTLVVGHPYYAENFQATSS
jgi:hypothetical protein